MKGMTKHTTRAHGRPLPFARRTTHPRAAGVLLSDQFGMSRTIIEIKN